MDSSVVRPLVRTTYDRPTDRRRPGRYLHHHYPSHVHKHKTTARVARHSESFPFLRRTDPGRMTADPCLAFESKFEQTDYRQRPSPSSCLTPVVVIFRASKHVQLEGGSPRRDEKKTFAASRRLYSDAWLSLSLPLSSLKWRKISLIFAAPSSSSSSTSSTLQGRKEDNSLRGGPKLNQPTP